MHVRLAKIDDDLDRTEADLKALEAELSQPPLPASRFISEVSDGGVSDLHPERADELVRHRHPSYSFVGRSALSVRHECEVSQLPDQSVSNEEVSIAPGRPIGTFSRAPRWSQVGGERFFVELHLKSPHEGLGLTLDVRSTPVCARVRSVRKGSAIDRWNAASAEAQLSDLQVTPGDILVEANGSTIGCPKDLQQAVAGQINVHLIFKRLCKSAVPSGSACRIEASQQRPDKQQCHRQSQPSELGVHSKRSICRRASRGASKVKRNQQSCEELQDTDIETGRLPGRLCRAVPGFRSVILQNQAVTPSMKPASDHKGRSASTFGAEQRFVNLEWKCVVGPELSCPSDHFLSNRSTPPSTVLPPHTKMRTSSGGTRTKLDSSVGRAAVPGLRSVGQAFRAFAHEILATGDDEVSTDAGSEEPSLCSGSSQDASDLPGPGSYSPDFSVTGPSTARGTPSFSRYAARNRTEQEHDKVQTQNQSVNQGCVSSGPLSPQKSARGGKINPPPSQRSRTPTAHTRDKEIIAARPFYDVNRSLIEQSAPVTTFGDCNVTYPSSKILDHSPSLDTTSNLGPGTYNLPELPEGPCAYFAPEHPTKVSNQDQHAVAPGPDTYDAGLASGIVYPRTPQADFGQTSAGRVPFEEAPVYVAQQKALEPNWKALQRRSVSALLFPEHRAIQVERERVGPASYDVQESLVKRLRPDVQVVQWKPLRSGLNEHTFALYNDRPVDRSIRGDPRPFLATDGDRALRPKHLSVIFRPLSAPPVLTRRSWAAGEWRFYDPAPPPSPSGLASFSRWVTFEHFLSEEARWMALESRHKRRKHPSLRLAYSLPSLDLTHPRPPGCDFTLLTARPGSDYGGDSPREGDALLLSLDAERHLFHPRAPAPVDMCRQLGRSDDVLDGAEVDDFEELILSPRPAQRRNPMFVDMVRTSSRPEQPDFSSHLWAEGSNGAKYTYCPSESQKVHEAGGDTLELSPSRANSLLHKRPKWGDFSQALGRSGVDPRVPGAKVEEDPLLLNWVPCFCPGVLSSSPGCVEPFAPATADAGHGSEQATRAIAESGAGVAGDSNEDINSST